MSCPREWISRTGLALPCLLLLTFAGAVALAEPQQTVHGFVYHDRNSNGTRDPGEPGLKGCDFLVQGILGELAGGLN